MNILFVCISIPDEISSGNMYLDLASQFVANGHHVTYIGATQQKRSSFECQNGLELLRVRSNKIVGEINLMKKGIAMALLPYRYKKVYKKYLRYRNYDWIVMPTPPITLIDFISYVKMKTKAKFYLILRDIHPQSSASLGEIKYQWMCNYLDIRSARGYRLADVIGCMSQANIDFICDCYPTIDKGKMKILYNWMKDDSRQSLTDDDTIRGKYGLQNKYMVLFGGNIALGQRIENIIDLAKHYIADPNIVFAVVGKGVKKKELERLAQLHNLSNIVFIDYMTRSRYLQFVGDVDLGLISINENNIAPTCPSKVISYMSLGIPVLALINKNNDYGEIIENAGAGYWAVGSDKMKIYHLFDKLYRDPILRDRMGKNGRIFYERELTDEKAFQTMYGQMLTN